MLTSVFAVDFTAGFQLKGEVFSFDGASKDVGIFKLAHENTKDDKSFIFSVSSEKTGRTSGSKHNGGNLNQLELGF